MKKLATLLVSKIYYYLLLHSKLHFKIGEGRRGHMHLPVGAQQQMPQTTLKHQESHLCLAAEFKRLDIHLAGNLGERRWWKGLNYISLGVQLPTKSNKRTVNT